jgi:hypothetical protein
MARRQPNTWTSEEAAEWAEINHRLLLNFFHRRLLPAIPVGGAVTQKMAGGKRRHRRVAKWIVPREAFIRAWQTFSVPAPAPAPRTRRRAA